MDGRDHNGNGFSVWLAGGGVKGGTVVGATDEYGYRAVENRKSIYELHATILRLLGLDHEKLTYRFNGRDMRLTDVHGRVIESCRFQEQEFQPRMNTYIHEWRQGVLEQMKSRSRFVFIRVHVAETFLNATSARQSHPRQEIVESRVEA